MPESPANVLEAVVKLFEQAGYDVSHHALNRTVGALSTHVQRIRRRLDSETLKSLEYEFQRIDAEIEYQRNLIERTRRLEGIPEIVPESVDVNLVVKASVERLQETYSTVTLFVEVEPELRIRATTSFLREVIDCLLENACQALTTSQTPSSPEVHVLGRVLGDTVRIDVRSTPTPSSWIYRFRQRMVERTKTSNLVSKRSTLCSRKNHFARSSLPRRIATIANS